MAEKDDFHKKDTLSGLTPKEKPTIPPVIPEQIGPYKIDCLMEQGGMSLLYLSTHPETKEPIIVKVLSSTLLANKEAVERFLKEAEIIAITDHPNIIKLYDQGEWEEGMYIAMEYIQGISLREYILQHPISLKHALEIIIDIAYALCHLHTHGVIHRDLKPENILISETGEVKVIDFGISQLLAEKPSAGEPPKQRLIGTPIYMSPEQRENPENVSYPSDIYSLGIIAYELILGKLSLGQLHLSLMPKGMHKILHRALLPRAEDRYQDIVDFITDVSAYLNSPSLDKEKKGGNLICELAENLRNAQKVLTPKIAPQWPGIEIGISYYQYIDFGGVYFDFFDAAEGRYAVALSTPSEKDASAIIATGNLRGSLKALCRLSKKPSEIFTLLNDILVEDTVSQAFSLDYLTIDPESNQCTYSCSEGGTLWHISTDGTPSKVDSSNPPLGVHAPQQFTENTFLFSSGETLVLTNLDIESNLLQEYAGLPAQKQAEILLHKARIPYRKTNPEVPIVFLVIKNVS